MNRDELERMADEAVREAHLELVSDYERYQCEIRDLIRKKFAAKVAAVEREACAKVLDEMAAKDKLSNYYVVAALAIRERGAP